MNQRGFIGSFSEAKTIGFWISFRDNLCSKSIVSVELKSLKAWFDYTKIIRKQFSWELFSQNINSEWKIIKFISNSKFERITKRKASKQKLKGRSCRANSSIKRRFEKMRQFKCTFCQLENNPQLRMGNQYCLFLRNACLCFAVQNCQR